VCDFCLLNLAILAVSRLSGVLGALGQILLSYLVHMYSCLRSLRQGHVHVGPITWEVLRQGPCLMSTRLRIGFGPRRLTPLATPSTGYIYIESSRRHLMNSSPVKSPMFHILESLVANALFLLKEVENLNLLLRL
jgi:hypothetical protein